MTTWPLEQCFTTYFGLLVNFQYDFDKCVSERYPLQCCKCCNCLLFDHSSHSPDHVPLPVVNVHLIINFHLLLTSSTQLPYFGEVKKMTLTQLPSFGESLNNVTPTHLPSFGEPRNMVNIFIHIDCSEVLAREGGI